MRWQADSLETVADLSVLKETTLGPLPASCGADMLVTFCFWLRVRVASPGLGTLVAERSYS